jgi:hypothetical protein
LGGVLDERGVAVIACVGLFEELSSGWEAAVSVFEESLPFTLPGILSAFTFVIFLCFEKEAEDRTSM